MNDKEKKKVIMSINSGDAEQPFEWSVGLYASKFLTELRDNHQIVGSRCGKCGKVYVPPRKVCSSCFVSMDEIVPLSSEGTLITFTVLNFGFVDPSTGLQKPVPYTWGIVKPDGADTTLGHFIEETDIAKLNIGMRVRAVFEEECTGSLLDIKYFEPAK